MTERPGNVSPNSRSFRSLLQFLLLVVLVASHLVLFHRLWHSEASRAALPGVVLLGLVMLLVAKHLGLLAVFFRRRFDR